MLRSGFVNPRFPQRHPVRRSHRAGPRKSVWVYRQVSEPVTNQIDKEIQRGYNSRIEKATAILEAAGEVEAVEIAAYLSRRRRQKLSVDKNRDVRLAGEVSLWLSTAFDNDPIAFTEAAWILGCQIVCEGGQ